MVEDGWVSELSTVRMLDVNRNIRGNFYGRIHFALKFLPQIDDKLVFRKANGVL